jgi:PKD repeat protein
MRRIAPFFFLALLLPAAPATAHWTDAQLAKRKPTARAAAVPRAAGPSLLPLSSTWCGTETASDETAGDTTLPHFKVIYAYPSDKTNQFAARKDLIEQKMKALNETMNAASGGQRELRLDTETGSCGRYVDIMSVQLPRTAAEYGIDLGSLLEKLEDDLEAKLSSPTQRNYVVWADLSCDSRCNGGVARTGFTFKPRLALVFGDNGTGSTFQSGQTTTFDVVASLHEMLHTIGAVNGQAPHVTKSGGTPLGHCWQEDDLMCQNEGDVPPQLDCPGQGGFDSLVVDCGQDDYFNVDPPAGSFLATNPFANTANSRFMMGPPTAALAVSKSAATAGETITLDASGSKDDNLDAASYTWDFEGDGVADQTTTAKTVTHVYPAGSFRPGVTVTDAEGMTATALATINVAANNPPPPPPGPGPVAKPATASSFALSPTTFRAATKGASVAAVKRPEPKPVGSTVRYRLDKPSSVTFTAEQLRAGKVSGKKCVAPTAKLKRAKNCTRVAAVKGSFGQGGKAGANSFKFTGRIANKALGAGTYNLIATPVAAGATKGKAVRAKFTIAKK